MNNTCIEIASVTPSSVCLDSNLTEITLEGRGFTNQLSAGHAKCRFYASSGSGFSEFVFDAVVVSFILLLHTTATKAKDTKIDYNTIVCPLPVNWNITRSVFNARHTYASIVQRRWSICVLAPYSPLIFLPLPLSPSYSLSANSTFQLQVATNGVSFVSSEVTLEVKRCYSVSGAADDDDSDTRDVRTHCTVTSNL